MYNKLHIWVIYNILQHVFKYDISLILNVLIPYNNVVFIILISMDAHISSLTQRNLYQTYMQHCL